MKPLLITTLLVISVCIGCQSGAYRRNDYNAIHPIYVEALNRHEYYYGYAMKYMYVNRDSSIYYGGKMNAMTELSNYLFDLMYRKPSPTPSPTPKPTPMPNDTLPKKKLESKWTDATSSEIRKTSHLLDTLPNKKIKNLDKMKPRKDTAWVSDLVSYESLDDAPLITGSNVKLGGTLIQNTVINADDFFKLVQDTIRCVMLCSDTSSTNGFISKRAYWMYGYILWVTKEYANESIMGYLDSNKSPLKKNIVVWVTKPVVQ